MAILVRNTEKAKGMLDGPVKLTPGDAGLTCARTGARGWHEY